MNSGLFFVVIVLMLVIGLVSHIVSYFLEKKYKRKMEDIASKRINDR